jgi:hypothetical protein
MHNKKLESDRRAPLTAGFFVAYILLLTVYSNYATAAPAAGGSIVTSQDSCRVFIGPLRSYGIFERYYKQLL